MYSYNDAISILPIELLWQSKKMLTQEAMDNDTKDVLEGTLSSRRAAAQYDIPSSTLHDCISKKVSVGAVSGPPRYLDEEEKISRIFIGMCRSWLSKICKGSESYSW